jgi:hypothetical protein
MHADNFIRSYENEYIDLAEACPTTAVIVGLLCVSSVVEY